MKSITKSHMDSTITWQANTVMNVEKGCIKEGKFPNGKKMTKKDIEESESQIENCMKVLIENGVMSPQLELFI